MAFVVVKDLSFCYPGEADPAVCCVSFALDRGEFVTLCGATGSGKSTLLRLLKPELRDQGTLEGTILFDGSETAVLTPASSARRIGFVMQHPEHQIVTDRVWHELSFGLENLGVPSGEIRRRVAEIAAFFGIEKWYDRRTDTLSGGEKQLLNLASVMVMQPDVLLLDEPTARLDPLAAGDFIRMVRRLNRELGLTVIIAEHRLDEVLPISDRLLVLDRGRLLHDASPTDAAGALMASHLCQMMPAPVRLWYALERMGSCPLSIREGRRYVEETCENRIRALPAPVPRPMGEPVLELRDVYFRYSRTEEDVLRGLCFTLNRGEIAAWVGSNGAGKSTALAAAAGLIHPYSGRIRFLGHPLKAYKNGSLYEHGLSMLPQDVESLFLMNTVEEELKGYEQGAAILGVDFSPFYKRHPYDLSGGEQQLLALAKVLASEPQLLLLDEPTKGLDASAKARLCEQLKKLRDDGMTILLVTHDIEFAASVADRVGMFFRGEVLSSDSVQAFFSSQQFYTTAAARMARGWYDHAVTVEDIAALAAKNREVAP